jgi:prepilin-type processing-associated H-X9-DG protein
MHPIIKNGSDFRWNKPSLGIDVNGRYPVPKQLECPVESDGYVGYGWNEVVAGHFRIPSDFTSDWVRNRFGYIKLSDTTATYAHSNLSKQMILGDRKHDFVRETRETSGKSLSEIEYSRHDNGANYLFYDGHVEWRSFIYTSHHDAADEFWKVPQ